MCGSTSICSNGTNLNDLPAWQKRGSGLVWEEYKKAGLDPRSKQATVSRRRRIRRELELPIKEAYAAWLNTLFERYQLS
jgi:tRNA(His) guanylyltransferase